MAKTTLKEIGAMLEHVVKHMATREDLDKLATKEQLFAVHKLGGPAADHRAR